MQGLDTLVPAQIFHELVIVWGFRKCMPSEIRATWVQVQTRSFTYLLKTYYVSDAVLGTGDAAGNKTDVDPTLTLLTARWRRQTVNTGMGHEGN